MPVKSRPELPFDIWEEIASILRKEGERFWKSDYGPLRALSLTSRAMVPLCRNQLFSTLRLTNYKTRSSALKRLIAQDPGIIPYIRTLKYPIADPDNAHILDILGMLITRSSVLQSIGLRGALKKRDLTWKNLPNPLHTALEQLIQLPSITTVELYSLYGVPSTFLARCLSLTTIFLSSVELDNLQPTHFFQTPHPVCLTGISNSVQAFRILLNPDHSPVDLRNLRNIKVRIGSVAEENIICDIIRTATRLESLDLALFTPYPHDVTLVGLGAALSTHSVPALRKLTVQPEMEEERGTDPFSGLLAELEQIAGSDRNVLEEIHLNLRLDIGALSRTSQKMWHAFDSLVTAPGSFEKLKFVSVDIIWICPSPGCAESFFRGVTARHFPKLLKSGSIAFKFMGHMGCLHDEEQCQYPKNLAKKVFAFPT